MSNTLPKTPEMLALVDHNDELVGQISREDALDFANLRGCYLRGITVLVMNSTGALWIPTRQKGLEVGSEALDYSVAGKVRHDESRNVSQSESYLNAAIREYREELNKDVAPDQFGLFARTHPVETGIPYFMWNYVVRSDETPQYNPEVYSDGQWMMPDELDARLEAGVRAKNGMAVITHRLLGYEAEHASYK